MRVEKIPVNICEELKIINLVLELIPIDSELKKNLNLTAIAIALKPRLNKIAHDMVSGDLKVKEPEPVKQESELKVGDYVEILEDCKMCPSRECVLTYYARELDYILESSIGKIGKVARILGNEIEVIDLPKDYYRYNTFWPYNREQLKKVDKPQPGWQPKFKVDDWVIADSKIGMIDSIDMEVVKDHCLNGKEYRYRIKLAINEPGYSNSYLRANKEDMVLWEPMQELNNRLDIQAKSIGIHLARVQDLESNAIRLRTLINAKNEMLDKERTVNKELKERLATKDKLLQVCDNSYSSVIDRISKSK